MELDDAPRYTRDAWTRDNNLGLRWAGEGRWLEAADAFARAVSLSAGDFHDEPTPFGRVDLDQEEAHAVLLSNLSQAQFETGRAEEALTSAQQALALREALLGEDAVSTARSRSQVAVMLGFLGRLSEAEALIGRAVTTMEQQTADDDLSLAPFLENAARLALAGGHVASAEPHLLRLHALLSEHGESVAVVDELVAHIAAVRTRQSGSSMAVDGRESVLEEPSIPHDAMMEATRAWQDALSHDTPPQERDEIDAHFTDALDDAFNGVFDDAFVGASNEESSGEMDKATAFAHDVTRESHAPADSEPLESVHVLDSIALPLAAVEPPSSGDLDVLDLQLELSEARMVVPEPIKPEATAVRQRAESDDIFGGASFDLVEPPPPTLNVLPQRAPATPSRANPLGFDVEYGVPQNPYEPTDLALPDAHDAASQSAEDSASLPETGHAATGHASTNGAHVDIIASNGEAVDSRDVDVSNATAGFSATPRVSPLDRPTPLVMPGRDAPQRVVNNAGSQDNASLMLTLHPADVDDPGADVTRNRRPSSRSRFGRTKAADPKRPWLIAIAVILVGVAALLLFTNVLPRP